MDYRCMFFGSLFTILGISFALGKIHIHLPVWKDMPEEEKKKVKIVPLCRNIGEVIMLNGIIFLLKGVWRGFTDRWFMLAIIAWFLVAGFDAWHISRSDRYQNEE